MRLKRLRATSTTSSSARGRSSRTVTLALDSTTPMPGAREVMASVVRRPVSAPAPSPAAARASEAARTRAMMSRDRPGSAWDQSIQPQLLE